MKKLKALLIMLVLVLSMSLFGLVACENEDEPKPGPTPGGNTDVPVADGKVTFYFTLADGSVAIPEYGAVFYAGGLTEWKEAEAPAFTKLEGKDNVYYLQLPTPDTTVGQWDEFSLTLGYSSASGLPADKQGIDWAMKSDECAAVAYPDNMKFTWSEGTQKVDLGTHTFSSELPAPETVSKVTLKVTFEPALDANKEVYIMGGFNGWDSAKAKATASSDRTVYSLELKDILCTSYEYKIVVLETGENVVTKDAEGNDLGVWDQYIKNPDWTGHKETDKLMARTEIAAGGGNNLSVKVIKRDNNSYIDLVDTVSQASDDVAKKGLDLSKAVLTEGKDGETPNGVFTKIFSLMGIKTLKVDFKTALPAEVNVYIIGSFFDKSWTTTVGQARMTIAADRKSASVAYEMLPGEFEFNVIFIHKDIELAADDSNVVQPIWDFGVKNQADNSKVTVSGYNDSTVNLYTEALTVPTVNPPESAANVTLKVAFDKAIPDGKHVLVAGSFEGWKGTEMTASADRKTFTLVLDSIVVKSYECKVSVSGTTSMDWGTAWGAGGEYKAAANANFTVAKTSANSTIDLFESALVTPDFSTVSVTLKVTFADSMTGKKVWIKGGFSGWADKEMTSSDGKNFTLTVDSALGSHEFLLGITADTATAADYTVKISGAGEYGAPANSSVTISAAGEVKLYGDKVLPSAPQA